MLLESIYKGLFSIAEPAFTMQRAFFYFLFIVSLSPSIDSFFNPIIFNDAIGNALKTFVTVIETTAVVNYLLSAIFVFYLLPFFHYYICIFLSKLELKKAASLIEISENLSKKNNEEIKDIIIHNFEAFRMDADRTKAEISRIMASTESLSISAFYYLFFSIKFDAFSLWAAGVLVVWVALVLLAQRRVTLAYLKHVLPYKVLSDRYALVFEDSPKS